MPEAQRRATPATVVSSGSTLGLGRKNAVDLFSVYCAASFESAEVERPDLAAPGHVSAAPMSGDLTKAPAGKCIWFSDHEEKSVKAIAAAAALWLILIAPNSLIAQEWTPKQEHVPERESEYSPYVDDFFPRRVFWGDTHHHSSYSFDSGMFGNTLGPDESFRFARGEEVVASNGMRAKLIRPLDFLVVSDHAAYLGFTELMRTADPRLMATKGGGRWSKATRPVVKQPGCSWSA